MTPLIIIVLFLAIESPPHIAVRRAFLSIQLSQPKRNRSDYAAIEGAVKATGAASPAAKSSGKL